MPPHPSLNWILPLFPSYRDLLHYKNILRRIEKPSSELLSAEDTVRSYYTDPAHPPPLAPPFAFTFSQLTSLVDRAQKRLELCIEEGNIDGSWSRQRQQEAAWQDLARQPSRRSARGRRRARLDTKKDGSDEKVNTTVAPSLEPPPPPELPEQNDDEVDRELQLTTLQGQLLESRREQERVQRQLAEIQCLKEELHRRDEESRAQLTECQRRLHHQTDVATTLGLDVKRLSAQVNDCENRLSEAGEALRLRLLLGYVVRACHEFTIRCPDHHRPSLDADRLEQVTLKEAMSVLNVIRDFYTFSASPDHQQLGVDNPADQPRLKKVFHFLTRMVHPDKLPADSLNASPGEEGGHMCVNAATPRSRPVTDLRASLRLRFGVLGYQELL